MLSKNRDASTRGTIQFGLTRKWRLMHRPLAQRLREPSLEDALASLERVLHPPSVENLKCILLECRKHKNLANALRLHAYLCKCGLEAHKSLGNYVVPMLVEVGRMCDAEQIFDRLVDRNEYSWTSLITGYIKCGNLQHAFVLHQKMQEDSVHPNGYTFVALLKACARLKDTKRGEELHGDIVRKGLLETDPYVGNTLVDMYAKCGLLPKAQHVFDKLPVRDVVSWNSLIAGCAEHGLGHDALNCFEQMQLEGISPNAVTFVCSLKACGSIGAIDKGQEIHAQIARKGLLETNLFVGNILVDMYAKCGLLAKAQEVFNKLPVRDAASWNTLVDMYAKCGLLAKAQEVFDKIPVQNAVSWTALIAGYAENDLGQHALSCFEQMQLEGVSPDYVTFVCSLKACGSIGAIDKGQEIHAQIARKGLLERNLFIGNTLIDMYAKCGLLAKAQEVFDKLPVRDAVSWNTLVDMYAKCGLLVEARAVFDKLPVRDAVSWNALIAGYAEHGLGQDALNVLKQMQLDGISPDVVTFVCSLKACGSIGAIDKGREIHAQIATKGLLEGDPFIGSTLVDMYAKCGLLAKAQEVFDKLPFRDAVSWTALIAGYTERNFGQDALNCFEQMLLEGISPNSVTFVCILRACGSIGAIDKAQEIHAQVARKGLLERGPFVGSTTVDMYAKCGLLAKAQEVFDKLPVRDAVSWNALIAGYAQLGEVEKVFLMLNRMRAEGKNPDEVTFLSILTVCSNTGLVEKGQTYFEAMCKDYGTTPTIEHHNCMVDLLGRAGQFDKAVVMIKKMPFNPNLVLWHTMLGACRKWGNVELGRWAFEHAVELDKRNTAAYVLMSNIYADAHMQEDAKQVELMRLKEQVWKNPGQSWWNDVGGIVHSFLVEDTGHSQCSYMSMQS